MQAGLTGNAVVGLGGRMGAELAISEINQHGGVNGRKLKLVVEDDGNTSDGGVLAVRKLVQEDSTFVILNSSSSDATLAALNFAQTSKTPEIVTAAVDPRVLNPFRRYIFLGSGVPAATAAQYYTDFLAKTLKVGSVSLVVQDIAYANSLKVILADLLSKAGVKVATNQTFSSNDTDFTAQIQAVKNANAPVLFTIGQPTQTVKIIIQARRSGVSSQIMADQNNADLQFPSLGGANVEGAYTFWISGTQFLGDNTGAMGKWRAAFSAANPNPPPNFPNQFSLQAYADTYTIAEAIRRAGANPTRDSFVTAMEGIKDFVAGKDSYFSYAEPVMMPHTFSATDHQGNHSMQPVQLKNGLFIAVKGT
jgi:branched-chain amino acid transport system substrate-binding protein